MDQVSCLFLVAWTYVCVTNFYTSLLYMSNKNLDMQQISTGITLKLALKKLKRQLLT